MRVAVGGLSNEEEKKLEQWCSNFSFYILLFAYSDYIS
jgi:hypothetical protein